MKKYFTIILMAALILCNIPTIAYADTERDLSIITTPIDFSNIVNSEDWHEMSVEERIAYCTVSESIAQKMTTEALVETVVTCPLTSLIYAFTTIAEGITNTTQILPQLAELLGRSDALYYLQAYLNSNVNVSSAENSATTAHYIAIRLSVWLQEQQETDIFVDPLTGWNAVYVKAPNNSNVMAYIGLTYADHGVTSAEAISNTNILASVYSATILASASPLYNCHAYAWYSTTSSYWIEDPYYYMTDGSYSQIYSPVAGCKVTYKAGNSLLHSGIVTSIGTTIYVTSKWGCLGVMRHTLNNNPYVLLQNATNIQYWN